MLEERRLCGCFRRRRTSRVARDQNTIKTPTAACPHFGHHVRKGRPYRGCPSRGTLLVRDELTGWIGAFDKYGGGSADRPFWLEAHEGGSYRVDRVKHDDPICVPHLSIGIVGGIQPDKLSKITGGADDGFAGRFLFAWPDTSPHFQLARDPLDFQTAGMALARLTKLKTDPEGEDQLGPIHVPLSAEAADLLEAFGKETVIHAHHATGPLAVVFSKARGHALRLATVLEFLWWCGDASAHAEPNTISRSAMAGGIDLMRDYFIPMAERVFGDASVPNAERLGMILARHLKRAALRTFNARDLRRQVGGPLRSAAAMDTACNLLVEANLIRLVLTLRSTPGRQPLNFEVNPVLFQTDS